MRNLKNSTLLETAIKSIYVVAGRRTSLKFADETINSAIETLKKKFDFLKYVKVSRHDTSDEKLEINISSDIDSIPSVRIGKAIEALIRIVYNDLGEEAGLYFITELKQHTGESATQKVTMDCGVDLDQIQIEQHYAYKRRERKKAISKAIKDGDINQEHSENLLGYTWGNVASWKHEPNSKYCTLYDKNGKVLDRLNLDRIIENYVEKLSGCEEVEPREIEKETRIYEKEYKLLKLMLEKDMDAETATHFLKISMDELNLMIQKLSEMEMLKFVDYDTVKLTRTGIDYLSKGKQEN